MKFLAVTSTGITIASLVGCCTALIAPQKRATTTALGSIYAYGSNISGSPVFVNDGIAYIGNSTAMDDAMGVTFVQIGTEISVHNHYRNGTDGGSDEYLAIDTTTGASNPVLIANSTVTDGYTTEGFNLYGTQLTWLTSDRAMESKFYVVETETTDVWELYWNADSATSNKGTDVILKAFGPPDLGNSDQ